MIRWLGAICGLLSCAIGLAGLWYVLFALPGTEATSVDGVTTTTTTHGMAAHMAPSASICLSAVVLALLGVAVGAVLHSRSRTGAGRSLLLTATAFLASFAALGLFSIGPYLAPSVLLAAIASALTLLQRAETPAAR